MQTIVLITRENNERATHVSVFLCESFSEARYFCKFVNSLPLIGEDKLIARKIKANAEYSLKKYQPFQFDDFVNIDDRTIQRVMRDSDMQIIAVALRDVKKEVKDKFFINMSKRAACMLEEDMENWGPVTESEIESARQVILEIYDDLSMENRYDEALERYKNIKKSKTEKNEDFYEEDHIVLVFRGKGTTADSVSVYVFNYCFNTDNFCHYLNSLKLDKGSFTYAMHAEQMTEYETTKPLLVSFEEIFDYSKMNNIEYIIRDALKKFDLKTILNAFKSIDKRSRTLIMQSLPVKITDEINDIIENSDKSYTDISCLSASRKAQQRILNTINKTADKYRQGKYRCEVLKR